MHVIIDFIPNHTSVKSAWFNSSVNDKNGPYGDFYIWKDPLLDAFGNMIPPNEWVNMSLKLAIFDFWSIDIFFRLPQLVNQRGNIIISENNITFIISYQKCQTLTWQIHVGVNVQKFLFILENYSRFVFLADVIEEIKKIMDFWLNKKPVMGFHIGDFNILFEDWSKDVISTDIEASKEFITLMHNHSAILTESDKLDRYEKFSKCFICKTKLHEVTQSYLFFNCNYHP